MGYLNIREGYYVVSTDIKRLQGNPCFMELTDSNQIFGLDAKFIGRADDKKAYYLSHEECLTNLIKILLSSSDISIQVARVKEENIPEHLKDNVLDYFRGRPII